MNPQNEYGGLLHRRECLVPTWRGLLLLMTILVSLMLIFVLKIHSFLAVTEIVPADKLVVEGWVPTYVMKEAIIEFKRGHYHKLYVTGGPIEEDELLSEYKSWANYGASTLIKMGMGNTQVEAVSAPSVIKDRTYTSAIFLKNWLEQQSETKTNLNLISFDVHSRRSQLLFQKAFGNNVSVGIIAVQDRGYNPQRWWKFSAGIRSVVSEFMAYIYALVIF